MASQAQPNLYWSLFASLSAVTSSSYLPTSEGVVAEHFHFPLYIRAAMRVCLRTPIPPKVAEYGYPRVHVCVIGGIGDGVGGVLVSPFISYLFICSHKFPSLLFPLLPSPHWHIFSVLVNVLFPHFYSRELTTIGKLSGTKTMRTLKSNAATDPESAKFLFLPARLTLTTNNGSISFLISKNIDLEKKPR
jgi:hypothetical protein